MKNALSHAPRLTTTKPEIDMNIKFLGAERISANEVRSTYTLDGSAFTVEWNNISPASGESAGYDLQPNTASDSALSARVDKAIICGETDENEDLDLYLFIIDTFDANDCESV